MNWPIGDGDGFQGVLDRSSMKIHLFQRGDRRKKISASVIDLHDQALLLEVSHSRLLPTS
jgi:peptide chain release factor 3